MLGNNTKTRILETLWFNDRFRFNSCPLLLCFQSCLWCDNKAKWSERLSYQLLFAFMGESLEVCEKRDTGWLTLNKMALFC